MSYYFYDRLQRQVPYSAIVQPDGNQYIARIPEMGIEFSNTNAVSVVSGALRGGVKLFLKPGIYDLGGNILDFPDLYNIAVEGELAGAGEYYGTNPAYIKNGGLSFRGVNDVLRNITIRNLTVLAPVNGKGLFISKAENPSLENVIIKGQTGSIGLHLDYPGAGIFGAISKLSVFNHSVGCRITGNFSPGPQFNECRFVNNTTDIEIGNVDVAPWLITFYECDVEAGNVVIASPTARDIKNIVFDGCYFESVNFNLSANPFIQLILKNCYFEGTININIQSGTVQLVLDSPFGPRPNINVSTGATLQLDKRDWTTYPITVNGTLRMLSKNKGTATLAAGSTSVVVNHGLAAAPNSIKITPQANVGAPWVTNVTATSFTINVATAPAAAVNFYWEAEV